MTSLPIFFNCCSSGTGCIAPIPVKYYSIYLLIKTNIMSHYDVTLPVLEHLEKQCAWKYISHTWPGNDTARIRFTDSCTKTLPFVQITFSCLIFSWLLWLLGIKCEVIKLFKPSLMYLNVAGCSVLKNRSSVLRVSLESTNHTKGNLIDSSQIAHDIEGKDINY